MPVRKLNGIDEVLILQDKGVIKINAYKIKYANGNSKIVIAKDSLTVIKQYDLATKEHINTRVIQLEGEQKEIALSNLASELEQIIRSDNITLYNS